jgi:acetyltransferase-like isoleucine patch superfamily enzyme
MISNIYKAFRKITTKVCSIGYTPIAWFYLILNGAVVGPCLKVNGILKIHVTRRGRLVIGNNCKINSGSNHNLIGRQQKNIFWVEGVLEIGNNVGMSCAAIVCNHQIKIGDNVTIGGNTVIYDSDFHSLVAYERKDAALDRKYAKKSAVIVENNVFIGAHTTILKGVTIGENSIIGACSVVAKSIPPNQIWAGNPARFIKNI